MIRLRNFGSVPHTEPSGGAEDDFDALATPLSEGVTAPIIAVAVSNKVSVQRCMPLRAFPLPARFTPSAGTVRSTQVSR
jgi:hypothetical protein